MTRREAWEQAWDETEGIDDTVERARRASLIYCDLIPERMPARDFEPRPWMRRESR